jgi:hypothetical protein
VRARSRRAGWLAAVGLGVLLLSGCDEVVLENPLDSVVDDRIVGSWARADGTLYAVIRKGDGDAYVSLDSDDLKNNKPGSVFYLAKSGTELFAESPADCNNFLFKAPSASDAPKGCWDVNRVVLGADSLEYDTYDASLMMRKSLAGDLRDVGLEFGMSVAKGPTSDPDTNVLIEGPASEEGSFLARYSSGPVYRGMLQLHRI